MKKLLLSLVLLAGWLHGFAQHEVATLTFIPKVGINLSNIAGNDVYYLKDGIGDKLLKPQYRIGFMAGIEGEYQVSRALSLSASALYSLQGNKYEDIDCQKNYSVALHYASVPLMLNYYVVKGLALKAGLQAGYAFYKKESFDQLMGSSWSSYSTSGTIYKNLDVAVPVGMAYDLNAWRLELRYTHGLTGISKLHGMPSVSNRVFQLSLGYVLGR